MGNRITRIILGIIIALAALVGIYFILPGSVKYPLQAWFQKTFQSERYSITDTYKNAKVPGYDVTFGDLVDKAGDGGAWVVEVQEESDDGKSGKYYIHAYIKKVDVSMEHENGQENLITHSGADVEIRFDCTKKADGSVTT